MALSLASPAGICVSVACPNTAKAIDIAREAERFADVIEIRLDSLEEPEVAPFTRYLSRPLLFTNRPEWEGGHFSGPEDERLALLQAAVERGCGLVDFELRAAPELRADLLDVLISHPETGLVISWHNFAGTPSNEELEEILQQQMESGAHIGKIVTMANNYRDVLRIMNLQVAAAENSFPLIAFCMGEAGMISRLATLKLGGYMTYASPDTGEPTAPGQLTASALRSILETLAE